MCGAKSEEGLGKNTMPYTGASSQRPQGVFLALNFATDSAEQIGAYRSAVAQPGEHSNDDQLALCRRAPM